MGVRLTTGQGSGQSQTRRLVRLWEYMDATDDALLTSGVLEDFGRFYDRYVRTLLGYFQRRTGNPEVAADLTAETFASAIVAKRRFKPGGSPAVAWLYT